jgi:hypothetical protein
MDTIKEKIANCEWWEQKDAFRLFHLQNAMKANKAELKRLRELLIAEEKLLKGTTSNNV